MSVIVYSLPGCVQCNATFRALDKRGIDYEAIDVSRDQEAAAEAKQFGCKQAPVVVAGTEHWSGFQPDKINAIQN